MGQPSSTSSPFANKSVALTQCAITSRLLEGDARKDVRDFVADIRPIVSKIVIYENIFSPVLTGEVFLQDDVGLTSVVPLIGLETLLLKFSTTDPITGEIRYYGNSSPLSFSIYSETDRTPRNKGTETYRLGLVSSELLMLTEKKMSRAYTDKKVEDIIKDIMVSERFCGTKKSLLDWETTQTVANLVIPYLTPMETIKLLTLQGQNETDTNYAFYETLSGFHFQSIRRMIERGQANQIPTIGMTLAGINAFRHSSKNLSADAIDVISGFNFLYQLSHGAFAATTIGVDILAGKYRHTISTSNDADFKGRILVDGANGVPMYPAIMGKYANPTATMFLVPTTSISAANTQITALDPSIKDNFIEKTVSGRNRELLSLASRCIRVRVSGAPELQAGTLVDIVVPTPLNNKTLIPSGKDVASGRYLILAAQHTLLNTGQGSFMYETVFEACSDSTRK